jgi:hypothetical protein
MRMRFCTSIVSTFALTALLAACGSSGQFIEQTLDPVTGVTVLRSTAPVILYSDNSAYAAHAREWSTMRSEDRWSDQRDGFESVTLFVDGQPLPLELEGWTLDSIGVTEPVYVKPVASAADAYYRVTVDQIRLIAESSDIQLRVGTARPKSYSLWDKQGSANASIRAFIYGEY